MLVVVLVLIVGPKLFIEGEDDDEHENEAKLRDLV